jgi:hypothetical protein
MISIRTIFIDGFRHPEESPGQVMGIAAILVVHLLIEEQIV